MSAGGGGDALGNGGGPAVAGGGAAGNGRAPVAAQHPQRPFALPAGATEVLLVRHGSSMAGEPGVSYGKVDGQGDPPLSPLGHEQAVTLAGRLAAERLDALFVTPLQRTAETVAPLAAAIGIEPVVVPDLREIFLGELEQEFAARSAAGDPLIRQIVREQRWDVAPGAEPMDAFAARIASGLETVADETGPDRRCVAVVHAGVVAQACRHATGSEPLAFLAVENASITRLVRRQGGRWTLRAFNDTAHLSG